MKLALWNKNTKQKPPQNKTQQPKQSSTSLNYSNDSESYDPKTRITRPPEKRRRLNTNVQEPRQFNEVINEPKLPRTPFYNFFPPRFNSQLRLLRGSMHILSTSYLLTI